MSLNLSIDVDLTIVDEHQELLPGVRECLHELQARRDVDGQPSFRLQLWSSAGGDYARSIAIKHNLDQLFDSFATKPDIAIDDLPDSTRPRVTMRVTSDHSFVDVITDQLEHAAQKAEIECTRRQTAPQSRLDQKVDPDEGFQIHRQIVEECQSRADIARKKYAAILRPTIPFHPIPFFGNIVTAEVVTVGLNPSSTEFLPERGWPETIEAAALTTRLLGYFHNTTPEPHRWFQQHDARLRPLGHSYARNAAHMDLSPWTTFSPRHLSRQPDGVRLTSIYDNMLASEAKHVPRLLALAKNARLLLLPSALKPSLKEIICDGFGGQIQYL